MTSGSDDKPGVEHRGAEFPTADDGFDAPSEETRRRNWLTAGAIVLFLVMWVVYGLRHALF